MIALVEENGPSSDEACFRYQKLIMMYIIHVIVKYCVHYDIFKKYMVVEGDECGVDSSGDSTTPRANLFTLEDRSAVYHRIEGHFMRKVRA